MAAPFDPEGLSTVHEVPLKTSAELKSSIGNRNSIMEQRSGSKEPSVNSSFARSYNESMITDPPPVPYAIEQPKVQHARRLSEGKLKKADRRKTVAAEPANSATSDKALKRGGLRNTIRKIFGRKSMSNRISMPSGPVSQHSVSNSTFR